MEIYSCKGKKVKWFRKVDWLRVIILFVIIFILSFIFFNFFVGGTNNFQRAVFTSIILSFLISLGVVVSYCIENRFNLYIEKDGKFYIVYPHSYGIEYDEGFVSYKDFKKMTNSVDKIEDILENIDKYTGIDLIEIKKIKKIKMNRKNFKFTAEVRANEWYGKGGIFTIDHYVLEKKVCTKRYLVPLDYVNSRELYSKLCTKKQ